MRISDWSSYVCSSDLRLGCRCEFFPAPAIPDPFRTTGHCLEFEVIGQKRKNILPAAMIHRIEPSADQMLVVLGAHFTSPINAMGNFAFRPRLRRPLWLPFHRPFRRPSAVCIPPHHFRSSHGSCVVTAWMSLCIYRWTT